MNWLELLRNSVHYGLHFLFPTFLAWKFYPDKWKKVSLILIATILVDLDHLLANPIFDPNRCSINFHLLHSYWAILIYFIFLFFKKVRIVALGLLLHMITDFQDCFWNS